MPSIMRREPFRLEPFSEVNGRYKWILDIQLPTHIRCFRSTFRVSQTWTAGKLRQPIPPAPARYLHSREFHVISFAMRKTTGLLDIKSSRPGHDSSLSSVTLADNSLLTFLNCYRFHLH